MQKKLISAVLLLLGLAGVASAQTVTDGTFGGTKSITITIPAPKISERTFYGGARLVLLANNFNDYSGAFTPPNPPPANPPQQAPPPDLSAGVIAQAAYKGWLEDQNNKIWQQITAQQSLTSHLLGDEAAIAALQSQVADLQARVAKLEQTTPQSTQTVIHISAETAIASTPAIHTEQTSDTGGGLDVGFIQNGQTYDYNVMAPAAGTYILTVRTASAGAGGSIQVGLPPGTPIESISVPVSGGWQTWQTISGVAPLNLLAGSNTIRLTCLGPSGYLFNIHWIEFTKQ